MTNQISEPIKESAKAVVEVVDTIKGTFLELVAFTKSIGPDVWEIMVRQQFAVALSLSILLILALIATAVSYRILKKRPVWALDNGGDNCAGWILSVAFSIISVVMIVVALKCALPRFMNPAYYALMELAKLRP